MGLRQSRVGVKTEPRSVEGDVGDRELPHGGARRTRPALRELLAYPDLVQQCRNRHCPKCQAATAKEWLAQREAELLPVPYFHSGVHLSRRTGVLVANGPEIALQAAAAARPAVPIVMLDAVGGSSARQVFTQRAPNLGALAVDALNVFLFWVSSRDASRKHGMDYLSHTSNGTGARPAHDIVPS